MQIRCLLWNARPGKLCLFSALCDYVHVHTQCRALGAWTPRHTSWPCVGGWQTPSLSRIHRDMREFSRETGGLCLGGCPGWGGA